MILVQVSHISDDTNVRAVRPGDCCGGGTVDWQCAVQDVPARFGAYLVGEGDACTDLAIFVAVVQQVSDFWEVLAASLLSSRERWYVHCLRRIRRACLICVMHSG